MGNLFKAFMTIVAVLALFFGLDWLVAVFLFVVAILLNLLTSANSGGALTVVSKGLRKLSTDCGEMAKRFVGGKDC